MMRFRVMAWLAALVVLAGCVEGSSSLPEIPSQKGIIIARSCDSVNLERFEILASRDFVLHEDSRGRFNVKVDRNNAEIVLSFISKDSVVCHYTLKFENIDGANTLDISPLPKAERLLLPIEEDAFNSEVELCSDPKLSGNQSGSTIAYFSELGVWLDQGSYIGCEADAKYQTIGLIARIGSSRFRIVQTMRQLTITKLETF